MRSMLFGFSRNIGSTAFVHVRILGKVAGPSRGWRITKSCLLRTLYEPQRTHYNLMVTPYQAIQSVSQALSNSRAHPSSRRDAISQALCP